MPPRTQSSPPPISRPAERANLWVELARELQARINRGEYPVGSLMPTEPELSRLFGVSRYTVRGALQSLQELGLVSRRKNAGTRVEASSGATRFSASPTSIEELAQYGSVHVRTLKSVRDVVAGSALAKRLHCASGTRWVHLGLLRLGHGSGDQPMSWIDVYLDPRFGDVVSDVQQNPRVLTSTLIERRYGIEIDGIEESISAIACPKALARKLEAPAGSPALQILRRYFTADRNVVVISVTTFPASRYSHTTYLRRRQSA